MFLLVTCSCSCNNSNTLFANPYQLFVTSMHEMDTHGTITIQLKTTVNPIPPVGVSIYSPLAVEGCPLTTPTGGPGITICYCPPNSAPSPRVQTAAGGDDPFGRLHRRRARSEAGDGSGWRCRGLGPGRTWGVSQHHPLLNTGNGKYQDPPPTGYQLRPTQQPSTNDLLEGAGTQGVHVNRLRLSPDYTGGHDQVRSTGPGHTFTEGLRSRFGRGSDWTSN